MKNVKVNSISQGAIMTALTVLFLVMTMYVPAFGIVSIIIAGVPLACLTVKSGIKVSCISFVASILILIIITGDAMSATLLGSVNLLPGLMIGYSISKNEKFHTILIAGSAAILFGFMLELILLNASAGGHGISNMLDTLFENVKSTTAVMVKTLTDSGKFKDVDLAKVFGVLIDNMRVMIEVYMPSILICTAAVMSYFVTMFCMFVMRRCNIKAIKPLEFSMIKVPKNVCYVAVVLFLITMFSHDSSRLTAALNNMVTILYFCVCVDGLSFVDFKLKQRIPKQYLRTIIYIAAFLVGYMFIGVVINILIILGMLDMTLDFRRIKGAGDYNGENE